MSQLTHKKGYLSKAETKYILTSVLKTLNNQCENFINDFDRDQDGYLTIDEILDLVINICKH